MTLKDLREKRNKLIADARAIIDKADKEKRGLSPEEVESQRKMLDDAKALVGQIRNAEDLEAEERDIAASVPESQRTGRERHENGDAVEGTKRYMAALGRYLRVGFGLLSGDDQRALQEGFVQFESRAMSTLTGAAGGFSVAPDTSFYGRVIEAEKYFGPLNDATFCTNLTTSTGADLPIATDDDTANKGARIAEEGSHAAGTNVTMGQKILKAYLYSSKIIKVSWQLLQDQGFDFEAYLGRKIGMRIGRIKNQEFTTYTGNDGPQGVQFISTVGRTSPNGQSLVTATSFDELKRLKHSVDVAYRTPTCRWMFNDSTFLSIALLKDGNNRYLLTDNVREADPPLLLGHQVAVNNDMPDLAASVKAVLFGDFSFYYTRRVRGLQVLRLSELYAENGQVGFMGFERADGALIDAGQGPIKALQQAAS